MTRSCPPLPHKPAHFGGRTTALETLYEKLRGGGTTAITAVQGLGGIGKSTLAHYAANELIERGEFCAVLTANINQQPEARRTLLHWWGYITDAPPQQNISDEEFALHVKSGLNQLIGEACAKCSPTQKVLVILDNVWDDGIATAEILRSALPDNSTILITTRQGTVADRLFAQRQQLDKFTPQEGAAVIFEYIQAGDETGRQALSVALGGHALALKIASARVLAEKRKPLADVDAILKAHASEYQTGVREGSPFDEVHLEQGDDNVRVSLAYSYNALPADDQRRFMLMGVLAPDAPFEIGVLAALWGCSTEQASDYANTLNGAGLIEVAEAQVTEWKMAWYWMHPLLRMYALALLAHDDERDDVYKRHFTYYQELHAPDMDVNNDETRHPRIAADWANVRAALDWGFEHEKIAACNFVITLRDYLDFRETTDVHQALLTGALNVAQMVGYQRGLANIEYKLGELARMQEEIAVAQEHYEKAMATYIAIGDRYGMANTEHSLGELALMQSEIGVAGKHFEKAMVTYATIDSRLGMANTERNLGNLALQMGERVAAQEHFENALAIYTAIGDRLGMANTEQRLGEIARMQGEIAAAQEYYEKAMATYIEIGNRRGAANTELSLGEIARMQGDMAALVHYEKALKTFNEIGDRGGAANTERSLGELARMQGEMGAAQVHYEKALATYTAISDRIGVAYTECGLGDLALMQGEMGAAQGHFEKALKNFNEICDRLGAANSYSGLGQVANAEQNFDDALGYFDKAIKLAHEIEDSYTMMSAAIEMATTWIGLGLYKRALQSYITALAFFIKKEMQQAANATANRIIKMKAQIGAEKFADVWREVTGDQPQPDWLT